MRRAHLLLLVLGAVIGAAAGVRQMPAKEKTPAVNPNDPTYKLYALLDSNRNGKLEEFYFLADEYKSSEHPDEVYRALLVRRRRRTSRFVAGATHTHISTAMHNPRPHLRCSGRMGSSPRLAAHPSPARCTRRFASSHSLRLCSGATASCALR